MLTNKIIRIERGERDCLAKLFKLDVNYVSSMLNFTYNSKKSIQVRHIALKDFGGKLYMAVNYQQADNKLELIKGTEIISPVLTD